MIGVQRCRHHHRLRIWSGNIFWSRVTVVIKLKSFVADSGNILSAMLRKVDTIVCVFNCSDAGGDWVEREQSQWQ